MKQPRDKLGRFGRLPAPRLRAGDRCPRCGGWIGTYRSIVVDGERRRYVRCTTPSCGFNPGGAWVESPRGRDDREPHGEYDRAV